MIGHLNRNNVFDILEFGYQSNLTINRFSFEHGHYPAIRQYAVNLYSVYCRYSQRNIINMFRYTCQYNSGNRHGLSSAAKIPA